MNKFKFKFYKTLYEIISNADNKIFNLLNIIYEKAMEAADAYEKELENGSM